MFKYLIILISTTLFAQEFSPEDFFPFHEGDIWEYWTGEGSTEQRVLYKDSLAAEGHYLFFTGSYYYPDLPLYLVDTCLNVIENPTNPFTSLVYKLDADSGDTWAWVIHSEYSDSLILYYKTAIVRDTYLANVLGSITKIMEIEFFNPSLFYEQTDYLAAGFGFIFRVGEAEQWPDYILQGAVINGDTLGYITSLSLKSIKNPGGIKLKQNYPNPFNPLTTIKYGLPEEAKVKLVIYDIQGRMVKELVNEYKPAGTYEVSFDGGSLASGIYFYRIEAGSFSDVKRMVLVK